MNLFLSSLPELESTDFLLLNWDNPNAIAYSFFEIFNYVIILICSLGFLSQLFFFIFSFPAGYTMFTPSFKRNMSFVTSETCNGFGIT